ADRARARRTLGAMIGLVLVAYAWRTWTRNRDWADELGVWSSAVRSSPASAKAYKGWAAAMFAADPRHTAIDRVIGAGEQAVAIRPDYLPAMIDLGGYYIARGDLEGGVWYARSVEVLERARDLDVRAARRFVEKMVAHDARPDSIPDYGNEVLY